MLLQVYLASVCHYYLRQDSVALFTINVAVTIVIAIVIYTTIAIQRHTVTATYCCYQCHYRTMYHYRHHSKSASDA